MDPFEAYGQSISRHLTDLADQKRIPISGTFELLPFCNMRCEMCYIVHEHTEEYRKQLKSAKEWEAIIDQAIEEGMLYMLLTGGEPFLYPEIKELLHWLNEKPVHIFINTNATLLNRETVEMLKQLGVGRLNISLYGASNETYARMCKNPKGFDQIINSFRLLKEYGIPFGVHTTLIPQNYADYEGMKAVCDEFEVPFTPVWYMFPPMRKDQGFIPNNARFSPEEAAQVAFRILKDRIKDEEELRMRLEANVACFTKPELYSLYGDKGITCKGGVSNFWVDWRGHISGCGINNIEQVDLGKESFHDAWKTVSQSNADTRCSEKCAYCNYRVICPVCTASAYTETGRVDGTPDYLCEYARHYSKLLIKELERLNSKKNG